MPATLQIGLIASSQQTSGSDRYYFDLVRALRALGHRTEGVVLGDPAQVDRSLRDIWSFAPEGASAVRRWTGLRRAVRPLLEHNDIIVSHFAPHVFPVLDVIRKRPLVEHFHGPWAQEARFAGLPLRTRALRTLQERSVYGRARRIIALSQAYGAILERDYGVDAEKIRVVPGGVDLGAFDCDAISRAGARADLGLPDRPTIVAVRRLESTKGVDRLIEAMATVIRDCPEALLCIAGTGSLQEDLARRVRELELERHVRFLGLLSGRRLALAYRAANVSVVPSVAFEGFGLACIESLACGTPVMATPVGGLPEVVRELEPRLVLAGAGAADIAAGLSDALSGRIRIPDEAACLHYVQQFAWPAIAARVNAVYCEVA
jgi:glycosyltransferase involved in cell wall biosynthesis